VDPTRVRYCTHPLPPPPTPPPLPYPTLFRSGRVALSRSAAARMSSCTLVMMRSSVAVRPAEHALPAGSAAPSHEARRADQNVRRSEEHTSELQSRENLVCRLLLEKKNATSHT